MSNANIRIIVVDDDVQMNQAINRLLSAAGFQAVTFPSAEALLEADGAANAACMVLDLNLPGLSGFQLHERLEQSGCISPVIFITAYDDSDLQAKAQDAGAAGYLAKPFFGRILLNTIVKALGPASVETV
jgi:FixJ family two-component response regulator